MSMDPNPREPQVEIYEDDGGGYRFRKRGANGGITSWGESYTQRSDARRAAEKEYPEVPIINV